MAVKFQYNKTSLTNLGKQLKIRQNALPTLKNKESALRVSVIAAKAEAQAQAQALEGKVQEYGYLCYTSERVIYKVPMPKLKDGDVIISRDDAVDTYQFPPQPEWMSTSRNQDRMLYQGKLLVISGVPKGEASVFMVLNMETREREKIIDFTDVGLTTESESLFLWRGDICVAFVDKIVRLIDFVDPF